MANSVLSTALAQWLQKTLLQAWSGRGPIATLLWPLAQIYGALVWVRYRLFVLGLIKTQRVEAMVIVVGNVVAGGAGKTPTVIALVQHLRDQNYAVGVISRGFGRSHDGCTEVTSDSPVREVGDEPLLIKRKTQAPVFVGRNRHEAATALLAHYPQTQILICDDGLQHYGLYRDLEVCVFDDRGCGNDWLLPAGPLREKWPRRLARAVGQQSKRVLVLHTGNHPAFAGFTARRHLASFALSSTGATIPLTHLGTNEAKPLVAMAGIAQPEAFFSMLRGFGLPLEKTISLPDHHRYESVERTLGGNYQIICTEKDAVKLWAVAPHALAVPLLLTPEVAFFAALLDLVAEQFATKLSSTYGHKTT